MRGDSLLAGINPKIEVIKLAAQGFHRDGQFFLKFARPSSESFAGPGNGQSLAAASRIAGLLCETAPLAHDAQWKSEVGAGILPPQPDWTRGYMIPYP
jgi:hypothetical protein